MSDTTNLIAALVTGGVGAAVGSIGTALVQTVSKRGESRAVAVDRISSAAGNLAERLDRININLEKDNTAMRKAIVALSDVVEGIIPLLPAEEQISARAALRAARLAIH